MIEEFFLEQAKLFFPVLLYLVVPIFIVAFISSFVQSIANVSEINLSFVPKLTVLLAVLWFVGGVLSKKTLLLSREILSNIDLFVR